MAQELLATVTFESVTGLPEDRVVNTFPVAWTAAGSPTSGQREDAMLALQDFYNSDQVTRAVGNYLSSELSRDADAVLIRLYDLVGALDGSAHGSPIDERSFELVDPDAGTDLPAECAAVLTTRASGWQSAPVEAVDGLDPGTAVDRPRQRLSGRVFIGPLRSLTIGVEGGIVRLADEFRDDLVNAGIDLKADLLAADFDWMVWSRVNQAMEPVTHLQFDNAFDTQRRRGARASARFTQTL